MTSYNSYDSRYYKIVEVRKLQKEEDGTTTILSQYVKVRKSEEEIKKINKSIEKRDKFVSILYAGFNFIMKHKVSIDSNIYIFAVDSRNLIEFKLTVEHVIERDSKIAKRNSSYNHASNELYECTRENKNKRKYQFVSMLTDMNKMRGINPDVMFVCYSHESSSSLSFEERQKLGNFIEEIVNPLFKSETKVYLYFNGKWTLPGGELITFENVQK